VAEKDFRVQKGLIVADGDVTVPSAHTVFAGTFNTDGDSSSPNFGLTMSGKTIAADGADPNIDIILEPKGTGSLDATRINNTVIGNVTPAAATVTALTATTTSTLRGAITTGDTTADTTITQADSAADAAGRSLTITAGSPPTGDTANTGAGGNLVLAAGRGKGTQDGGSILFQVADGAGSSQNLNNLATALTIADDKSFTFGGAINFGSQNMTNVDIDSGTIDDTTIGATTPSTIVGTSIEGTSLTIDDVGINGKVITMTGDTNDTVTMTAAAAGAFTIATTDNSGFGGNIIANADGNITLNTINTGNSGADAAINLQYDGNTKVAIKSGATAGTPVLDVTGNVDISGSLVGPSGAAGVTNIVAAGSVTGVTDLTASGEIRGGHADLIESDGILGLDDSKSSIVEVNGTNFYTSEAISITVATNQTATPGNVHYASGNYTGQGVIKVMTLNTDGGGAEVYQVAEALAVFSHKDDETTPVLKLRTVQKVIGYFNEQGLIESTVTYESGNVGPIGRFEWVREADAFGTSVDGMTLIWAFTKPTAIEAGTMQISCNVNGMTLQGAGG
jgi:hypothetical protein